MCFGLILSFLANSIHAAPGYLAATSTAIKEDTRFFLFSNNFFSKFSTSIMALVTTKPARSKQVSRIKIFPEIDSMQETDSVRFSAVAYDSSDNPLSGVDFSWASEGIEPVVTSRNLPSAEFKPSLFGKYRVTVSASGVQAEREITVTPLKNIAHGRGLEKKLTGPSIPVTSAHPTKPDEDTKDGGSGGPTTELIPVDGGGWDNPGNQTGNPPGSPADNGAGNGNFQISAPILSLAGRGTDLALGLNYNSRLWNKSYTGSQLTYDIDRGYPGPGWSLGFGKILDLGATGGALIVDADGTRHSFHGQMDPAGGTTYFTGQTSDGTFIDYSGWGYYNPPPGIQGGMREATVNMPNGTVIWYGAANNGALYPAYIRDVNGNYLTVTYRNNQGPAIQNITDTAGRVINFNYDNLNRLISVTAPRIQGMGGSGTESTLVKLHYKQLTLNYSFTTTPVVANGTPYVLDAIYFPGTGSGYWFGDADSYSTYGMIAKVVEQRGMTWTASSEAQGTVTAGQMTRQLDYNYPLDTTNQPGRTNGASLSDAPTYDNQSESWAGMDDGPAVTKYVIQQSSTPRTTTVIQPSGAISRQYSYNHPNVYDDGLVYQDESYVPDPSGVTIPNVTGTFRMVSKSTTTWQEGEYHTPRPTQAVISEFINGTEQKVTKTFDYTGGHYNQIVRTCDYDNASVKLQCTVSEYENGTAYTGNHLFNLVKATGTENPDGSKATWTTFEYDNYQTYPLADAPGVTHHEFYYDPYTTATQDGECIQWGSWECGAPPYEPMTCYYCEVWSQVSAYNPATEKRGNVTKITAYTDANNLGAGAIEEIRTYDKTGNNITSFNGYQQISFKFDDPNTPGIDTQYAYPVSQTRGSSDPNSPDRITSSTVYSFETGLPISVTDPNGRVTTTAYNPDSLRPTQSTSSTGAYSTFAYDEVAMTLTEETHLAGGALAGKNIKYVNGLGLQKREDSLGVDSIWDIVETKYNKLGLTWKQSRPYRTGDTIQWTETTYDDQGRTKRVIDPNGSYTEAFYNEATRPSSASATLGNTIRVADAWGRERWGLFNQQGRLIEVVEPDPNGNGSVFASGNVVTKYTSDTMGHLIRSEQGDQERKFKYDSLGRLTRQKLAEQTKTLNDAGSFVGAADGSAQWSEAFFYDGQSNISLKTDSRGVRTYFYYANPSTGAVDQLNRLQVVAHDISGPLEPNVPVAAAYNYSFEYVTTGDKTRIKKVDAPGLVKEEYAYDSEGRVSDYTQTIAYRESYPMMTSYLYDSLGRVTDVRYPAAYGLTGNPRKLVQHSYDIASRLSGLTVDGTQQAGSIVYNSSDQTTSIKIGPVSLGNQVIENYAYDPQTGLLTFQETKRGKSQLLNLTYLYDRGNSSGTLNGKTGSLTKIIDNLNNDKNRDYEYDAVGRLKKAKGGTSLWEQQYTYDRYGNRTNVTASGLAADGSAIPRDGIPNLSYNTTSNRISTTGYEYDAMGNQTRALAEDGVSWVRYEYDAANRLRVVKQDNGTLLQSFMYGSTNARLMAHDHVTNQLTLFVHNEGSETVEYTEFTSTVPTWTKSNVYLGGNVLSVTTPNGIGGESIQYSHPDRLGARILTNQNGFFTSYEQSTLPFGTALPGETTGTTSKRFTSYDRSARTGLDYAINRTYDSKQGRFTQVDPIGVKSSNLLNPQTLNLYAYCGNDPINHVDADGLFWGFFKKFFSWLGKILKFVAVIVAVAVAILAVIYIPGLGIGILAKVLGIISAIASAISEVLSYLGYAKAAAIFGIISAAASFGTSLLNAAGNGLRKLADYTKKIIYGVIKAGANLASKVLAYMGHSLASKIAELVSFVSGYIQAGYGEDIQVADPKDPTKFKMKSVWKGREWWKELFFVRGLAERVATIAGATKVATYLGLAGVVEDIVDLIDKFGKRPDLSKPTKGTGGDGILEAFYKAKYTAHPRATAFFYRFMQSIPVFNKSVGRVNKVLALP